MSWEKKNKPLAKQLDHDIFQTSRVMFNLVLWVLHIMCLVSMLFYCVWCKCNTELLDGKHSSYDL